MIEGFIESSQFERLAAARDLRREEGFAFLLDDTLITGVLDVIATEPEYLALTRSQMQRGRFLSPGDDKEYIPLPEVPLTVSYP